MTKLFPAATFFPLPLLAPAASLRPESCPRSGGIQRSLDERETDKSFHRQSPRGVLHRSRHDKRRPALVGCCVPERARGCGKSVGRHGRDGMPLAQKTAPHEAWGPFSGNRNQEWADVKVAIKPNSFVQNNPRVAVISAVSRALIGLGVQPSNIIVYDGGGDAKASMALTSAAVFPPG